MPTKESITKLLRDSYPHLAVEYGVKRIGLFGSFAKGLPNTKSDIDVIVEFERPLGFKFMEFAEYLEHLLGCRVDILTVAGLEKIRVSSVAEDIARSIVYV